MEAARKLSYQDIPKRARPSEIKKKMNTKPRREMTYILSTYMDNDTTLPLGIELSIFAPTSFSTAK